MTKEFSGYISKEQELLGAAKEWVQWFDYVSSYQHENLVSGQTLESASENWGNMQTPNPSPSIDRLRQAVELYKNVRKEI